MAENKRLSGLSWEGPAQVVARGGFLTLTRRLLRNRYQDGSHSRAYEVESALTPFLDAVVLVLFAPPEAASGRGIRVVLRRSVRPAVAQRAEVPGLLHLDQRPWSGAFWELPAGGVEKSDLEPGGLGLLGRASQECWEEAGLRVAAEKFFALGPSPFSAPAFCPERLHYLCAEVDPGRAQPPPGDGHPMEEGAELRFLELDEALDWCQQGRILDGKTELGLRRLEQLLATQGFPGLTTGV